MPSPFTRIFAASISAMIALGGIVASSVLLTPALSSAATPAAPVTVAAVPRAAHVVVVVMENHSAGSVFGSPAAPYVNQLAAGGAAMSRSFGVTHPSQPNYLALFSGDTQGVVDDTCPKTITGPDLGSTLLAAGSSFAGYSEDLPSVGFAGCASGAYARKHNPWVDFPAVPASANLPMTAFPTDYTQLPAVSFVIPNLLHDMHDGTVSAGDTWLHDNLDGYARWATTHDSVLVVTFDEDDNTAGNQVATVVTGARVVPGTYPERIDHYSVLRTISDAAGVTPVGQSAAAAPILDIWAQDPLAPRPVISVGCPDLTCAVDGSASTAAAGAAITGYRWDWGDGSTPGAGAIAAHPYRTGDFVLTLTATDDQGRAAATTAAVSPRPAGQAGLFVSDTFDRTRSAGLGTAPIGGTWVTGGSALPYSVVPGTAHLTAAKAGTVLTIGLPTATSVDTDLRMTLGTDRLPSGAGLYLGVVGRHVAANTEYQGRVKIRADGSLVVGIQAFAGTTTATVVKGDAVLPGVTATAGSKLATRLQVVGTAPTTLRWKVWPDGAPEPPGWSQSGTDSTPILQSAGSIGLYSYLAASSTIVPVTTLVSAVSAGPTVIAPPPPPPPPPVNQLPVAAFTATCAALACTVDGSASSDPDGTVAGWAWTWGDGSAVGSGRTAVHPFAAAGSYQVVLTVTDSAGGTATTTRTVSVAPADSRFLLDAFARTVTGGFGTADRGGAWTITGGTTRFSVSAGTGSMVLATPGSTVSAALKATAATDTDLRVSIATDRLASNSGTYLTVTGRQVAPGAGYQATVRIAGTGAVVAGLSAVAGGLTTALRAGTSVPGLTAAAGVPLRIRLQVTGLAPTSVRLKVWSALGAEPAAWTAAATDSTAALQAAGATGLTAYLSSTSTVSPLTVRVSDLSATPAAG